MSFANKFLGTGSLNVSDGTVALFGSKVGAKNLIGGANTVKIDGSGCLFASAINSNDIAGVVANPLTEDLDLDDNSILNTNTIEISNGSNSITLNYNSGISDQNLDIQTVKDIDDATQNINATTTSGQTDLDGDVTVQGDLQFGGSLIGNLEINDVNTGGTQTNDLNVSVTNFPVTQPVSGSVSVSNFPVTQPVSGSVSVSNFPSTQVISDINTGGLQTNDLNININSASETVPVTGSVIAIPSGIYNQSLRNIGALSATVDVNSGSKSNGTQRIILTDDYEGTVKNRLEEIGASSQAISVGSGTVDAGCQRTVLSNDYTSTNKNDLTKIATNDISVDSGVSDTGCQRTVLSNDYTSTVLFQSRLSSWFYERRIITGNLAGNYGVATQITFGSWSGNPGNIYLTNLCLSLFCTTGIPKMQGWGSNISPLTNGFYITYKKNSSAGGYPLMGSGSLRIKKFGDIAREAHSFSLTNESDTQITANILNDNHPILIENQSVGTRGTILIDIGVDDLTDANVSEIYLLAGYYFQI